ncbi:hypothetical protein SERLADRAFT_404723 [Serpula lacrymans var. lacrymans S7.9]|uniref:Uncharacterized protein n=1 Tax=Serpula lacrymans var. lacrymans (strain S7.9) TaxID=578457 RepID=F8NEK9_SERL9|nr:uncharacterized protein SERLADRAFT_404723 [Serpula lacrymans var. lacrymans S7.9]EGO30643.1 hypothetical protein SERLADRAFT_404723 [Serpula lacrymans var. lacrymans S7.9]
MPKAAVSWSKEPSFAGVFFLPWIAPDLFKKFLQFNTLGSQLVNTLVVKIVEEQSQIFKILDSTLNDPETKGRLISLVKKALTLMRSKIKEKHKIFIEFRMLLQNNGLPNGPPSSSSASIAGTGPFLAASAADAPEEAQDHEGTALEGHTASNHVSTSV